MLEPLARWCYRHRWRTVFVWIGALIASIALMNVAGGAYTSDFPPRLGDAGGSRPPGGGVPGPVR
jgi:uncharacterized membrane protein YdfJ with MMPL/SSD domain